MNIREFAGMIKNVKNSNGEYKGICPSHKDDKASLSFKEGNKGIILKCHAGCDTEKICDVLGLKISDLFFEKLQQKSNNIEYIYFDENGKPLHKSIRTSNKEFFQKSFIDNNWVNGLKVEPIIYNLVSVLKAIKNNETIYIVEGEKDVENLRRIGLTATTSPMGAGKWKSSYNKHFKDANVVILPDNDSTGKAHAQDVYKNINNVTKTLRIVELDNLPSKGDVSDWLACGKTKEDLLKFIDSYKEIKEEIKEEPKKEEESKKMLSLTSGSDLMKKEIAPLEYIVDDLLTMGGVYLLAGASKMGKSWLSMDLSMSISNGMKCLGKNTKKTKVLYIDMESSERSVKSRIYSMFQNNINLDNWFCIHECTPIGEGFEEDITRYIKEFGIKLIVIDVFVKIRSINKSKSNEYQHDYKDLGILKKIAHDNNVCFLVLHHLRKMKDDDDVFNTMTGSTGIMGAVDGAILLQRKRGEEKATLHITGRDIRESKLAINFNKNNTRWDFLGNAEDIQKVFEEKAFKESPFVEGLTRLLDDNNGCWIGLPKELIDTMRNRYNDIQFPTDAKILGRILINTTNKLLDINIEVRSKKNNRGQIYTIKYVFNSTNTTENISIFEEYNNLLEKAHRLYNFCETLDELEAKKYFVQYEETTKEINNVLEKIGKNNYTEDERKNGFKI